MLQPWDGFYILQRVLTCMISYEIITVGLYPTHGHKYRLKIKSIL